jgi:hypothetical protein
VRVVNIKVLSKNITHLCGREHLKGEIVSEPHPNAHPFEITVRGTKCSL